MLHIVAPLDGSKLAEQALGHAVAIAKAYPARITLFRVVTDGESEVPMSVDCVDWKLKRRQVEAYLESVAESLRPTGLPVRCAVGEGRAAEVMCRFCADEEADLIVLSRFGRGGVTDFGGGSTARKVLARASISVLLVGPRAGQSAGDLAVRYQRILVPIDGSLSAAWALGIAAMIAQVDDAQLDLVQIVERPALPSRMVRTRELREVIDRMEYCLRSEATRRVDELKAQLPADMRVKTTVTIARDAAAALHATAEASDVDLIVLSARGDGDESDWRYGSVCEALLTHTMRPVLVLQQAQTAQSQQFRSIHLAEPQADVG